MDEPVIVINILPLMHWAFFNITFSNASEPSTIIRNCSQTTHVFQGNTECIPETWSNQPMVRNWISVVWNSRPDFIHNSFLSILNSFHISNSLSHILLPTFKIHLQCVNENICLLFGNYCHRSIEIQRFSCIREWSLSKPGIRCKWRPKSVQLYGSTSQRAWKHLFCYLKIAHQCTVGKEPQVVTDFWWLQ